MTKPMDQHPWCEWPEFMNTNSADNRYVLKENKKVNKTEKLDHLWKLNRSKFVKKWLLIDFCDALKIKYHKDITIQETASRHSCTGNHIKILLYKKCHQDITVQEMASRYYCMRDGINTLLYKKWHQDITVQEMR